MKAKKTSAKIDKQSQSALKKKSATKAPVAARTTPAKKAAKPAADSRNKTAAAPVKRTKSVVEKVNVQEKSQPATKPGSAKNSSKGPATKAVRTPSKGAVRAAGAPLTEDDIREMSEDDYMNEVQLDFFRTRLLQMREEVLQREMDVKERLHEREVFADPADRATAEEEHWLDLRLRERESLLLKKIDDALRRIEGKEYGYCEKTGDPIGIPRLLSRPTATVCVDVKGQDERVEAQFRDR